MTSVKRSRAAAVFSLSTLLIACQNAQASLPQVDFDRMGTVGLAGAFAGLELFDNTSAIAYDPTTSTLISRTADGSLSLIGSTNAGGRISAGCALGDLFYVAGSFTTVNGTAASNIASYASSTNQFAALGSGGPNGEINTLYCDSAEAKIWAGGKFTSPGSAVAVWDTKANSWSKAPFNGLTGASAEVMSIIPNTTSSSLFFAGSFITSFEGNATILNTTNNPNVPYSAGATPFSSSLVPVPLGNADIDASPSSSDPQFSDIKNTLCPKGPDGPGNSWFAADGGNTAVVIVRTYMSLSANGVRLGNTFQSGHGTTAFSVETLPDNTIQTLQYVDPASGQNKTCSQPCPLLTDPSIPYQDFLFTGGSVNLTGVQIKITSFTGTSAGLHILQLLSSGAFASAVPSQNGDSCYAPNPSNTTRTGTWNEKDATTNIPATIQSTLVSMVKVGTSPANGPSFTWMPYVSASGTYDISILVPGCNDFQDCDLRTSVKVVVFPGGGQSPVVTIVDQRNGYDATKLLYSGPVVPSSSDFDTTITMTLADQPVGKGQNGQYEIVADRIQLLLTSANVTVGTGQGGNSPSNNGTASAQSGFGFLEYAIGSTMDATSVLSNASVTTLDAVGISLFSALGGSSSLASSNSTIGAVVQHPTGDIYLGGTFKLTSGLANAANNIVVYRSGALSRLANNGLNGPVSSIILVGDKLYVGGSFSDTSSPSQATLQNIALYDVQQDKWSSLLAGVNGPVTSLGFANGKLQVAGNFTTLLSTAGGTAISATGFATWDTVAGAWTNNGGFLVGAMSLVANGTAPTNGQGQTQFIAGNIQSAMKHGSTGLVMLQNGANGAEVTPLDINLGTPSLTSTQIASREMKSHIRRAAKWFTHMDGLNQVFARQNTAQPPPLPAAAPTVAPSVLAGAFWTNTTSSKQVTIIGGNFSFTSTGQQSSGIAVYNPEDTTLTPLEGTQVNGTIRALLVQGNLLFVGGEFTLPGSNSSGFAIYNLVQGQWQSLTSTLEPTTGSNVVIRSITASSSASSTIFVAGSFSSAGSTQCQSICAWDMSSNQWKALGTGIEGDVSSVAYAGNNQEYLVASGSILLQGATANVAQYTISNTTWHAIGTGSDLPGVVTAVEVNGGNASSIFAAGRSSDGSTAFLSFWNGDNWTLLPTTLQSTSDVSQLAMVPLQTTHSSNNVIEQDRMLLISGSLISSTFGVASSALFDGVNYIPYIMSTQSSGKPGFVSALFHSLSTFSFSQRTFLATGVVILISIAIAAGVVFFLALIGILWTLFSRREDQSVKFEGSEDDDDSTHHRPSSLLEHINAATRTTILGASPFGFGGAEKHEGIAHKADPGADSDPFSSDGGQFLRTETPSEAMHHGGEQEETRAARVRYSFDGAEEGELALAAGAEVEVLDDKDPAWWYARDATGKEGVVPAAYLY